MNRKRLKSIPALVIFACAIMAGQCAWAQDLEPSQTENGYCGDPNVNGGEDVSYVYEPTTHTLTISGTGAMESYEGTYGRPWNDYYNCITTIVINNGVTSIGDIAFRECENLLSVTIPGSVTEIGYYALAYNPNLNSVTIQGESQLTNIREGAFCGCESLSSFTIPASVTSIGGFAFGYCTILTGFEIPAGVTFIGPAAFSGCPEISSIYLAQGNANFLVEEGVLFNNDGTRLICYPAGKSGSTYTVPAGVRIIDECAFSANEYLTSVTFENHSQLTTIGIDAFAGDINLESIAIPDKVTGIGDFAFYECMSLATITFDDASALDSIGMMAFDMTPWYDNADEVVIIGSILYKVKDSYTGPLNISNGIKMIGRSACMNCTDLTAVTIPESVTTIGEEAFQRCNDLTSVTFTGNSQLTTIGEYAFAYSGLTSITIPASVSDIGDGAFEACSDMTTVTFDGVSHLTKINDSLFNGCNSLMEITIPPSVTSIGEYAFWCCGGMTAVTFDGESQLNYIGSHAFRECQSLTAIEIPASVTHIGYSAFYLCDILGTVTFAANSHLTIIDEDAFKQCAGLLSITIPAGVTKIGDGAFVDCSNLATVSFADNSQLTSIGEFAFCCTGLSSITIPECVTNIGECAFDECGNLTTVYVLPTTPPAIFSNSFNNINANCRFYLHGDEYEHDINWNNDVINNFENFIVFSLALGPGITASGPFEFTANGRTYYTLNTTIHISGGNIEAPVGYHAESFFGYAMNRVPIVGNLFNMPSYDVRVSAVWVPIEWEGSGTENDPYMIAYPSQMDLLAERVNSGTDYTGKYFKLANDITYSYEGYGPKESNYVGMGTMVLENNNPSGEITEMTQPVQPIFRGFNGTFDGNGKTISGIRMYERDYMMTMVTPGIFNVVSYPGVVKNLTVKDTRIYAEAAAGGIAGSVDRGSIENCISYADLHVLKLDDPMSPTGLIGGIVGQNIKGRISDCTSYSTITTQDDATICLMIGGIVGAGVVGVIDDCNSYSSITIGDNVGYVMEIGGISGNSDEDVITDCFSSATIVIGDNIARCEQIGGIVGKVDCGVVSGNIVVNFDIPDIDEYAGAIMGQPVNDVDYRNNYYSNCTIGNNTDNIGSNSSDITTDDAAVKATILFETETAPSTLANGEKVVFRREFKQGLSSTVCLPVAIDETLAAAAGKFYTFAGVDMTDPDEWTVVMQEVAGNNLVDGDLQANTPYLFMPDADGPVLFIGEADGSSVEAGSAKEGNWSFIGTYESVEWKAGNADLGKVYGFAAQKYEAPDNDGDSNPDYVINPGKFVKAAAGASIAPYRSYLMYSPAKSAPSRSGARASEPLPGSMKVKLLGSNGVETAVGKINTETGNVSIDVWYDMGGRLIQGAPVNSGMYIHGGKTIMINE